MARVGQIARTAAEAVADLTGCDVAGVSAVDRTEDGWSVAVDVVELTRVPDTTSVLATYEVRIDRDSEVTGFRRVRRFLRSATEDS
jgi:hypothetical protein